MKPTYEEYKNAKEIVDSYERYEEEETPILVGYLTRRIGYNGYKTCLEGHPVYEYNGMYYIEIEPEEGSKHLPTHQKFYKHSLDPFIDKL